MRAAGLEWLHRLSSEPKRLTRRYAHDAAVFPRLVAREALRRVTGA
jgi:N-acetylglucosaminyldiphosphoundecaprenol N-acetyl-beta-D-mannosaminyltransferase